MVNPYKGINWDTINQYKSNFHCHTMANKIIDSAWTYDLIEYPAGTVFYRNGKIQELDGGYDDTYVITEMPADIFEACPGYIYGSDGSGYVKEFIETYAAKNYDILGVAEHGFDQVANAWWYGGNIPTWPWTLWHVDMDTIGMLDVKTNELSDGHHKVQFFSMFGDSIQPEEEDIKNAIDENSIVMLAHPGRYYGQAGWEEWTEQYYADLYEKHNQLFAMEIINNDDQYPNDRVLFDKILTLLMPYGTVIAIGNDDSHGSVSGGTAFTTMLMEELRYADLRESLLAGRCYVVHYPGGTSIADHNPVTAPAIDSIVVDEEAKTIKITASRYNSITWYSGIENVSGTDISKAIGTGDTYSYGIGSTIPYVRAEIVGDTGTVYTQAWGFVDQEASRVSRKSGGKYPSIYP